MPMSYVARPPLAQYVANQCNKRPRSPDKTSVPGAKRSRNAPPSKQLDEAKATKRAQRDADQEHFRTKYREEFPKWSFFFTTSLPAEVRASFALRIQELGARYETFFSSKVTHVITSRRQPPTNISNKENVSKTHLGVLKSPIKLSTKSSRTDEDLLEKAKQFGMKIWEIEKLDSVLNRTQYSAGSPKITRSPKLNEILEAERRTGTTTERDPYARRSDYEYFPKNCYFVLIEDISNQYSTIAAQEYPIQMKNGNPTGSWPTLHLHPLSHCPFTPFDAKEARRRDQAAEAEKIRKQERRFRKRQKKKALAIRHQPGLAPGLRRTVSMGHLAPTILDLETGEQAEFPVESTICNPSGFLGTGYLAASGNSVSVISGTGTTSASGTMPHSVAPLALRKQIANQVVIKRNLGEPRNQPALRKAKSTTSMRPPKREETAKPGFCESCRAKFADFAQHVQSRRHRRYALDNNNFLELDCVLDRVKRRTLHELDEQLRQIAQQVEA